MAGKEHRHHAMLECELRQNRTTLFGEELFPYLLRARRDCPATAAPPIAAINSRRLI